MSASSPTRQVFRAKAFIDNQIAVISSASLGGSGLSSEEIADILSTEPQPQLKALIAAGVLMPIIVPDKHALSDLQIVLGDLPEQVEQEWVGRFASRLNVPCGQLLILSDGCCQEDWDNALLHKPAEEKFYDFVEIPPGEYVAELFAFVNSGSAKDSFLPDSHEFANWFEESRPGMEMPPFVKFMCAYDKIDEEPFTKQVESMRSAIANSSGHEKELLLKGWEVFGPGLEAAAKREAENKKVPPFSKAISKNEKVEIEKYINYLLRLRPITPNQPATDLTPAFSWFEVENMTFRKPELCPLGVLYSDLQSTAGIDEKD